MIANYGLVPVALASALACGVLLALPACIKQPLAERLGMSEGRTNLLMAVLNLTLIPLLPLAGVLTDHMGVEHALIAGSLLAALGVSLLALYDSFATAFATVLLIGAATASLLTSTTVLLPMTFCADKPAAALNLGYVFVGLALVLTGLLSGTLLPGIRWRRTLLLVALFCLLPALAAALTSAQLFGNDHLAEQRVLQEPVMWLAGLVCFLYLPLETALSLWATSNLKNLGYAERRAAWLLGGFWAAFLLSRLAMAGILYTSHWHPHKAVWFLFGFGICLAIALGNLAGAASRVSTAWGLLLAGLFCGPIYPTLIGMVIGRFPAEPGTAFGTIQAVGTLGLLLTGPMIAFSVRQTTVPQALRVPLAASLLLAAVALVLGLTS
jgi:MFS family permease